mgnify:CR=1 FL=1
MKAKKAYWINGYDKEPIQEPISSELVGKLLLEVRNKVSQLRKRQFTDYADTYYIWIAGDGYQIEFSSEDE